MNTERVALILFSLVTLTSGALLYGTLTDGHNWGDDFASYIMQAESLAEGTPRAFVETNRFAIENSTHPIGPNAYPWGFPLLLAPCRVAFGLNLFALKIAGALSYLLFLVVLWFGFRRTHSPFWRLCLVGIFALNPTMLVFADNILPDLPFYLCRPSASR